MEGRRVQIATLVKSLEEPIIARAQEEGRLRDGVLAERLIRERHHAAETIRNLMSALELKLDL